MSIAITDLPAEADDVGVKLLAEKIWTGDNASKGDIICGLMRRVHRLAKHKHYIVSATGVVFDEVYSAGLVGLVEGVDALAEKQDHPNPGAYIMTWVRGAISREINRDKLVPESTQRSRKSKGKEPYFEPQFESLDIDSYGHEEMHQRALASNEGIPVPMGETASRPSDEEPVISELLELCADERERRMVLFAVELGDYSPTKIAAKLRMPESTVRTRLQRIRERYEEKSLAL